MKRFLTLPIIGILLLSVIKANACAMPDSSVVYFKLFSTQTYLPVLKKDFKGGKQGGKMVIKNSYFKQLLADSKRKTNMRFYENIRMSIKFKNEIYYINDFGDIQRRNTVIGTLNKATRDHLDKGFDLYEWGTCLPMDEVLIKMYNDATNAP